MLPTPYRLRDNRDFRKVYAEGKSYVSSYAVIYVMRRNEAAPHEAIRFGFVVSKKQGKAVVRNRIKRRLSEAIRLQLNSLVAIPYDVIFVGRSRLKTATWDEVQTATTDLLKRGGVLRTDPSKGEE